MNKKILITDDEEQIRKLISLKLKMKGYKIFTASDGKYALDILNNENIDLLLTDLIMPNEEGIGTILKAKAAFPDLKIIAMSGGGRIGPAGYLDTAKQLGADEILTKPIDFELLNSMLENLLK
ncbi:MAG: response regulator [Candidatus Cloacimonadota bacterium]|nr:response regulator [Candidatus Cloacimonadota bacterium]